MVVGKTIGWALPVAALLAACGGGGGTDVDGGRASTLLSREHRFDDSPLRQLQ